MLSYATDVSILMLTRHSLIFQKIFVMVYQQDVAKIRDLMLISNKQQNQTSLKLKHIYVLEPLKAFRYSCFIS